MSEPSNTFASKYEDAKCCYFCIPMNPGIKFLAAFNLFLTAVVFALQMPGYWAEDATSKGVLNKGDSLSPLILSAIIGLHVSCIVETVLWFRD